MRRFHLVGWMSVFLLFFSTVVMADEITDAINEGLQYYKQGKLSEAMGSLNYAAQLIGQKKGGSLEAFLPKPIQGWTAEDPISQAAAQMLGGAVSAERRYQKDSANVTVRIVTDSPLLQGMIMMMNNPMIATSDGGKLEKISDQKAIVKYNTSSKEGSINIVLANRFLITVEGNDVSVEDLKSYASAIDYVKLASLP